MDRKRRSSILKRYSTVPSSPTLTRRISFHDKKSVKEFSEGYDKATIWHNSYEEEAVKGTSIDKENIDIIHNPQAPDAKPLKSALKSAPSAPAPVQTKPGCDDDMDLTPLSHNTTADVPKSIAPAVKNLVRASLIPIRSPNRPSHLVPKRILDNFDHSPLQDPGSHQSNSINMDVAESESWNDGTLASRGRRDTIMAQYGMEMTLIEPGHTTQAMADIEKSIAEMKKNIHMPGVLLSDDEDEDEFYRSIHQLSFDNTSVDSDPGAKAITSLDGDFMFDVSDDGPAKLVDGGKSTQDGKLDFSNVWTTDSANQTQTNEHPMSLDNTGVSDTRTTENPSNVRAERRTAYEDQLNFTNIVPKIEFIQIDDQSISVDAPKTTSRRTVYEGQLDITAVDPGRTTQSTSHTVNKQDCTAISEDIMCESMEIDEKPMIFAAGVPMQIDEKTIPIKVPVRPTRRTVNTEQPLDITSFNPDVKGDSMQIDEKTIPIQVPVRRTRRTAYTEQPLDITTLNPDIKSDSMQLDDKTEPIEVPVRRARRTVYKEEPLDITSIDQEIKCPPLLIEEKPVPMDGALKRPRRTVYDDQLDFTAIAPETKPIQVNRTIGLVPSIVQTSNPPSNRTVFGDKSIIIDSTDTGQSAPNPHHIPGTASDHNFAADESIDMHMTRLTYGTEENMSLDISDTFHMKRGLFSSTKIAGSNNALNEDVDMEISVDRPYAITKTTHLKSVAKPSDLIHRLNIEEQRQFDRTLLHVDAASDSNFIDEVSDSVLITPMEASSSMRLFRTNSQDTTTTNTTEELCNMDAEQLCHQPAIAVPSRYESIRLSGLVKHVNVTLSQSDEDTPVLDEDNSVATEDKLQKVQTSCSVGPSMSPWHVALPPLLERTSFAETDQPISLDYSGYDRLNMYADISDVMRYHYEQMAKLQKLRESRGGISLNVLSPGPVALIKNLVNTTVTTSKEVAAALPHGLFPTIPPMKFLLHNYFDSQPACAWAYDDLFFVRGRLRFINKWIPSVILYARFDYKRFKQNESHITFTAVHKSVCEFSTQDHMTPINWIRHTELMASLPPEALMQCRNSNHLIAFLDRLNVDHYARVNDDCTRLEAIVAKHKALILRQKSDGKCFIQKRIFDRERLERLTIVVELVKVEFTARQHIFTEPVLDSTPNAGQELGQGIVCIERILSDPFRYLARSVS